MKAVLKSVTQEANSISTFHFEPERPLRFVAGQFIEVTLPHSKPDDRGVKRWFTVSSAPGHEQITITTKHAEKPSSFKSSLWELKPEDSIDISEPMGDFVLPKNIETPLIFVAGGIGITPYHSIVSWLLDKNETRDITFIYSVKTDEEIIFKETLNQSFIKNITRINQPNLTAKEVIKLASGIDQKQIYISGPEPMTEAIVEQFSELGITQDQLITDYFPGYQE